MPGRSLSQGIAAVALALTVSAAQAQQLPAPARQIQDYEAAGFVQLDLPADATNASDPGVALLVPIRQVYVRPDSVLLQLNMYGQLSVMVASRDTERVWNPGTGYVLLRQFRSLRADQPSPMLSVQMSLANLARIVRELPNPRLLPDEDLTSLEKQHQERLKELTALRLDLKQVKSAEEARRDTQAAGEQARLRDDLDQIPFRKANPCFVVEFQNKDLGQSYLSRGLMQPGGMQYLERGRTRF
jgi:hypothetical protein